MQILMSPPSKRIQDWISSSNFPDRKSVEDYVRLHGGWSASMEATLDFVFGKTGDTPIVENPIQVSPLEELQGIKEPTNVQEMQQERDVEEIKQELKQSEGQAPAITPQVEQQQTIIRRLRNYISRIFGG